MCEKGGLDISLPGKTMMMKIYRWKLEVSLGYSTVMLYGRQSCCLLHRPRLHLGALQNLMNKSNQDPLLDISLRIPVNLIHTSLQTPIPRISLHNPFHPRFLYRTYKSISKRLHTRQPSIRRLFKGNYQIRITTVILSEKKQQ